MILNIKYTLISQTTNNTLSNLNEKKNGLQGKFEDVGRNFIKIYRMEICQSFDFYPTEL